MTQGVAYRPTEENRRTVKLMAGLGVPHDGIAVLLEIDPKTLRKHFDVELERGSVEATAKVAQSLFQLATTGKNVAATIFWMKARAGWREKHDVVVTNADSLTHLTDEELQQEIRVVRAKIREFRTKGQSGDLIEGFADDDDDDDDDD